MVGAISIPSSFWPASLRLRVERPDPGAREVVGEDLTVGGAGGGPPRRPGLAKADAVADPAPLDEDAPGDPGGREARAADGAVAESSVEGAREGLPADHVSLQGHLDHVPAAASPPLQRLGRRGGAEPLQHHGVEDRAPYHGPPRRRRAPVVGHRRRAGPLAAEELGRVAGVAATGGVERSQRDSARADPQHLATGGLACSPGGGQVTGRNPPAKHLAMGQITGVHVGVAPPRGQDVGAGHHGLGPERFGGCRGLGLRRHRPGHVPLEVEPSHDPQPPAVGPELEGAVHLARNAAWHLHPPPRRLETEHRPGWRPAEQDLAVAGGQVESPPRSFDREGAGWPRREELHLDEWRR
jgi:hypothetical protein